MAVFCGRGGANSGIIGSYGGGGGGGRGGDAGGDASVGGVPAAGCNSYHLACLPTKQSRQF